MLADRADLDLERLVLELPSNFIPTKFVRAAQYVDDHWAAREKVVVWASFRSHVCRLQRLLEPHHPAVVLGDVARQERADEIERSATPRLNADRMIRSIRPLVGGSMRSSRQRAINCSRTRSPLRSDWVTFVTSHSARASASATLPSRNPSALRICARWNSIVRPDHCRTRSRSHLPLPDEPRNRLRRPGFRPFPEGTGLFHCRSAITGRSRASSPHACRPPGSARRPPTSNGRSVHLDATPEPRAEATPSARRS